MDKNYIVLTCPYCRWNIRAEIIRRSIKSPDEAGPFAIRELISHYLHFHEYCGRR
jgi:hypothetical protein